MVTHPLSRPSARLFPVVALAALFAVSALAAPKGPKSPEAVEVITLDAGTQKHLALPDISKVALGDPEIADIHVDGSSLRIDGGKKGETKLLVWTSGDKEPRAYKIIVR